MARKKQLLAFLLAFALAFTTLVTPTVKAAPGDVIVDPIEGTKDDLLKFYDATGYVDDKLSYSALQYLNTAGDKIAFQLTMYFNSGVGWGSKTNDMTADNYFWGKFAIRFKDPAFYKQINSITVGSDAMTKYVFPTEQSDRNGSVWALKITDLPYNLIGSINNRDVVITLNDGKSLADLGLDQTKLYFDTAMLRSGPAEYEGKIERQSISNGYILGTEDRSTGTSDWDGARQGFVPADRGGAITRTFIDLTPGSEAIKVTYGFAPKQNFLQTDYAWVVYPEQQIPQELVQYINKDALKIGSSDKDGNLNVNRTMSLSSTSLDDSGFMTVSKTNTLSIVYDNPQTLKHLNEVRTNQDANLYYGTLGQPRYFTVSYSLDLVHNKLSDFIDAFGQVSDANNGQIPVTAWLVGDYPNKDIGQTAQKTDLTADNPDGAPRRLPNSLTQTFIASTDSDGDGIADRSELSLGTDPSAFDTDGDGKSDGQEVIYDSTNPMDAKDYLPEGPKADSTVLKDPAAENVVTGTALPLYSTDPDSETGEKIKPTNSDAGDLIVSLYKYAPTQGDDGDEVPGYEGSSYATTKVSLDELKGEGKYSLTIPANALTDTSIRYVLVATSPNGENPVLGDVIGFEGIQLDPNGGTKADGTSDPENVMTAASGKTTLPLINDWKNGEKQLIGWSTNPQAVEPEQLGEDYLYNGASLDANLLNDDPKTLYAVWADPITISLEKVWKDADGSPATPSVAPVQVGLMYRTAVGIPGAEIINDPLAAYSPVQGSVHELVDGKTSWTLNGYDNTGKRLSYVAIEMPQVEGLTAEQIADEFYAFDQSKQSWANLGVTLVESKQDEDGHITPGYKTQFTQVRNTDDTVDAYSSATRRTPTYKDDQTKNIITAYAITMTNTRLEVAQPTIKQAYTDDTKLEVVAPIDANAQAVVITLPEDRDGDGENDVLVLKTLGNAPYDYAVDPKNSSADAQVTVEIVPDPTDGVPTFVVNGLEPFTVGETATAVAQKYDAETGKTIESKETVMTVKDRVASATPTNPAQGVKTEGNEAVITADAGTVSGVKPPETATFVLLKDDGTGNYVSVTDADGSPVVGSVDPETGKITVNVPEGSSLEHDDTVIIRQQDTPQQTPSDSAPVVVDLQGPTITAQDINGVVNKQLNETITTDEPALLTQEGLVSGLRIDGLASTTDSWTISGAAQVDGAVDKQDLNLTATDVYGNVGTLTVKQSFKAGVSQIDPTADAEEGFVKIVFNAGEGIFAADSNPEIDSSLISADQKQIAYQVEDQLSWDAAQKLGVIVPTATDPTDGKVFSKWDPALPKGIEHVAEATYTAIFVDPNPPVITAIDDQTVEQGEPIKTVSVQVDDETATIEVTGLPDGVTYDETAKTISGTPTVDLGTDEQKTFEVTVTASDDDNSVEEKFTITVTKSQLPAGDGYTLADPKPTTVEGIEEDGTKNAIKPDEGTTLIPPTESVSGLNVDEDGNLTGTPTITDWGTDEEERQITIPVGVDTNGDGTADKTVDVPVIIQRDTDGDKTPDVTDTDDDNDGLTDEQEKELTKTDPKKEDTDGNGTTDDKEDLDNDGLTNKEEVNGQTEDGEDFPDKDGNRPTDPLNPDTDGDQINDGEEVKNGTDPTDPSDPGQPPVGDGYTLAEPAPTTVEGIEEDGTKNAIKPDEGTTLIPPTESVSGLNVDEDGNLTGTPTVDDWGPIEEERQITIPVGIDTNGDGTADKTVDVPVIIQRDTDGDKTPDVTDTDDDNDGLTDDQETQLTKTDPKKEDTDGNGTTDDKEDLDNDGLTNKEEVNGQTEDGEDFPDKDGNRPTDPLNPDTDGDQINDGEEVKNGTDPTDPSDPGQPPVGDGYTLADPVPTTVEGIEEDGTKNAIKPDEGTTLIPPTESVSGLNVDEDGNLTGTPTVDDWGPNEEERTITIVVGIDIDGDGAEDETAQVPVIIQRDTDGDKTPDVTDTDDDNDGLTDDQENELTRTDPKKEDTDGDGTTDDEEDLDNDGLTNKEEVNGETEDGQKFPDKDGNRPTDPLNPDTDGDQINDGEEVKNGTDPTDPTDPAKEDDASKYNPVGQTVEVNKGEDPKAEDGIKNKDDLPKGTKYEWETKVDTSKPGDQSATIVVTYPDGSSDTVKVTVKVKKDDTTTPGTTPGTKPIEMPKLKIVLVDGEGNHIHETATFKLNDKIVPALSSTVKTDGNGKATIATLTDGEYELTQIVTPDGYATLEQPIKIKVSGRHIWIDGTLSFDNTVYVVNQKKGAAAEPTSPVERVDGLDRAEVAVNLAKRFFGDADKVILVQSGAYADAMSALNVSQGRYPILYTKQLGLYGVTLQALQELKPNEIILVGGPKTIDPAVAESLKTLTEKVTRVDGHDRYEVNANSALYLPKDVTRAVFASGMIYTDALSSAPLAGQQKAPLLLVREGNVPKEVKAYLQAHASITEGTIVGGPVTVGAAAKVEIESLLGKSVSRISGADRFEVSANVARKLAPADMALVTSGMNWSDALVAGPVAQKENAPILLTRPETLPGSVAAYLKEAQSPEKVLVIGGPNSVSENVLNTLRQLRKGAVESVNTTLDPAA